MAEIIVKIGRKGDEAKVDKSKIAKGAKPTQADDAEGQYMPIDYIECWRCHAMNEIVASTDFQVGLYCWNCGAYCVY